MWRNPGFFISNDVKFVLNQLLKYGASEVRDATLSSI